MNRRLLRNRWLLLGFMPLLVLVIGLGTAWAAGLTNGSFETGTTQGWTKVIPAGGSITVETAADGNGPMDGTFFARLTTNGPGSFTTLRRVVTVAAGAMISGSAYFADAESGSCTFNDVAEVKVDGTTVFAASSCATGTVPWTSWSHTFVSAGTFTVEARIANGSDSIVDSSMGLDDVQCDECVPPVPVGGTTSFLAGDSGSSSGSIALLVTAVAAVMAIATGGWFARRRWLADRS